MFRFLTELPPRVMHAAGPMVCVAMVTLLVMTVAGSRSTDMEEEVDSNEVARLQFDLAHHGHRQDELGQQIASVRARLLEEALPLKPASTSNRKLEALHQLADRAGVRVNEMGIHAGTPHEAQVLIPVEIAAQGTYDELIDLLHLLHREAPDITVIGFDLSGNPNDRSGRLDLAVSGIWHALANEPG